MKSLGRDEIKGKLLGTPPTSHYFEHQDTKNGVDLASHSQPHNVTTHLCSRSMSQQRHFDPVGNRTYDR